VSLDLKKPEGQDIFRRLAQSCDALIDGYRPGALGALGLSYDGLQPSNPGLVYCSVSAYGSSGPLGETRGSELEMQALIGKNRQLGVLGEAPVRVGYDMVSTTAGWATAQGVMAALLEREKTGLGQRVETSLLDVATELMQYATAAETDPDQWRGRPLASYVERPDHGYQSKDGPFLMDFGRGEEEWRQFCTALGADELIADERFSDFRKRTHNDDLRDAMSRFTCDWSFDDLYILARGLGASIVRINTLQDLANEPQVAELDIIQTMEHPVVGAYSTLDVPWKFSEPIVRMSKNPAPALGQHGDELLAEIGYAKPEIQRFRDLDVVGGRPK
ncbi:CoA transferase, partial [Dehalococcoidia bacterium]|nr:CoA transferase [Dehalococcoidia bacterium]